ncbi:MAG: hypothetical protein E5Y16_14690 [Mesorhizobium sp.]|nr:MAG: hypothetical protein EOS08_08465 [Mesorhizobium sp.]TIQ11287.1 MAG: hypothetical protein E5X57_19090 [Mesorhizobium sp.]TJV37857.1 MAG: hypothetical protein E5Y16_14690 [Mesorhizobium sp.]
MVGTAERQYRREGKTQKKIITPGEPKVLASHRRRQQTCRPDVSLGDLREWHTLRAWCRNCSHHAEVRSAALIRRYGKGALFSTVEGTWLPGN